MSSRNVIGTPPDEKKIVYHKKNYLYWGSFEQYWFYMILETGRRAKRSFLQYQYHVKTISVFPTRMYTSYLSLGFIYEC